MGNFSSAPDFYWSYSDEPHASRRREILKKYPQIKDFYGHDSNTKYIVVAWASAQLLLAYLLSAACFNASWGVITVIAYLFGGFAAQALYLAMHEISHNLAFQKPLYNKLFGIFIANPATVAPHFCMFQKYHMEHHQYQGIEGIDTDVPTKFECWMFQNPLTKTIWLFFQLAAYGLRPLYVRPKPVGSWELLNLAWCVVVSGALVYFLGPKSIGYLLLSGFLGSGIHPVAGHFIAEHYVFAKGIETYSYYGPLNVVCFNVGYHNEHHDFPRIPGSRLPLVRKIAAEYYQDLPCYNSWVKVLWDYVWDPSIGPQSRVKRKDMRGNNSNGSSDVVDEEPSSSTATGDNKKVL